MSAPIEMAVDSAKKGQIIVAIFRTPKYNDDMKKTGKNAKNKSASKAEKPKPPGRPSLGKDSKTIGITIKISQAERRRWEREAKALGMTLRQYIIFPLRKRDEEGD